MSTTARKEREKIQRQESIIYAARELFYQKGYQMTTMEEIAEKAELSKGTLYLYFDNKDELYISVISEGFRILEKRLQSIMESGGDVLWKGREIYYAFINHCLVNKEHFRITQYFISILSESQTTSISRDLIESVHRQNQVMLDAVAELVREGKDEGIIREDIDPGAFAVIGWRLTCGLLDLAFIEDPKIFGREACWILFEKGFEVLVEALARD